MQEQAPSQALDQQPAAAAEDDFFSDAPLASCPMRKDGMGEGEVCEACQ